MQNSSTKRSGKIGTDQRLRSDGLRKTEPWDLGHIGQNGDAAHHISEIPEKHLDNIIEQEGSHK